jgi:hypothetical protein
MQTKRKTYRIIIICVFTYAMFFLFSFTDHKETTINVRVLYDSTAFREGSDTISYKSKTILTWNDFKGSVPARSSAAANSAVGFKFDVKVDGDDESINLNVTVAAFFVKSKSWVKSQHATDYILKHEQGHFDLARVGVQLLKKYVEQQKFTKNNYTRLLEAAYEKAWNEYIQLQEDYDEETNHSIHHEAQKNWNKKIEQLVLVCN